MKYIETELKKKRSGNGANGDEQDDDDDDESAKQPQVMTDIYEELYHLPDRLKVIVKWEWILLFIVETNTYTCNQCYSLHLKLSRKETYNTLLKC
jgi:hypothetical protein